MERVRDYISFVVWFVGLSYVAMWPAAVPGAVAAWLGHAPGTLSLSRGLNALGMAAAFWVTLRLMLLIALRIARLVAARAPTPLSMPPPAWLLGLRQFNAMRLLRRRLERVPPPRYVPPRRQFGLRGEPR